MVRMVPPPSNNQGGTVLGTSRGGANIKEIVRRIDLWGLNMVFVVGGNGGNAAAHAIAEECEAQVGGWRLFHVSIIIGLL